MWGRKRGVSNADNRGAVEFNVIYRFSYFASSASVLGGCMLDESPGPLTFMLALVLAALSRLVEL